MTTKKIAPMFAVSSTWARGVKQLLPPLACRTRDTLWRAMQSVLHHMTASDAANAFRHCGYMPRQD